MKETGFHDVRTPALFWGGRSPQVRGVLQGEPCCQRAKTYLTRTPSRVSPRTRGFPSNLSAPPPFRAVPRRSLCFFFRTLQVERSEPPTPAARSRVRPGPSPKSALGPPGGAGSAAPPPRRHGGGGEPLGAAPAHPPRPTPAAGARSGPAGAAAPSFPGGRVNVLLRPPEGTRGVETRQTKGGELPSEGET